MPHTHRRIPDLRSADGQTMSEYGILLALVFAVVLVTLVVYSGAVLRLWNSFSGAFGG